MSEPVRIVVTVEGGIIQAVCTLGVPVEALVIDYDIDGGDPAEVAPVDQGDGSTANAYVRFEVAEPLYPPMIAGLERFWPEAEVEAEPSAVTIEPHGGAWRIVYPDSTRSRGSYEAKADAEEAAARVAAELAAGRTLDEFAPFRDGPLPRAASSTFERAKHSGYDVEPDGFVGGFNARDPEGDEIGSRYPTEQAAWEACDRHRMFGDVNG